jgi:pyruvate/2-oxoglutarate/acetoin dehydrogenase E1 component
VLAVLPSSYFNTDEWLIDSRETPNDPGIIMNNTINYLSFLCKNLKDKSVFRVDECQLLFDSSDLTVATIKSKITQLNKEHQLEENKVIDKVPIDNEEYMSYYNKCLDMGYSEEKSKELLNEFIRAKENEKKRN